jgi:hypothetical protein
MKVSIGEIRMMKINSIITFFFLAACFCLTANAQNSSILVEAESFNSKGGWVVDSQFVEQMGSPYLLAHGMGKPVNDAETRVSLEKTGTYYVWVRTKNWAPGNWDAPGRFYVAIDGQRLENQLGKKAGWNWDLAGKMELAKGERKLSLQDLTGFEGRCDALYLTMSEIETLPHEKEALKKWRAGFFAADTPGKVVKCDLVVVGGGLAGCAAAMTAVEQGLKVALVHDRPVLGGNASSEIRVRTLGIYGKFERILKKIDNAHYPNGSDKTIKDTQKRMANVMSYKNIELFLNYRAFGANAAEGKISSVDARQTSSGEFVRFEAPLFVDCTGDGWIGYWAGAEYSYGREAFSTYGEKWDAKGLLWSPATNDNRVMGSSVLWGSENAGKPVSFPEVPWAMDVAKKWAAETGGWEWEFSQNDLSQIDDAETIRDHLFKAIYGSFYNYKKQPEAGAIQLKWVSFLLGKRESRRLVGDHIYTFNDMRESRPFEDAVVFEKREVDVHYQWSQTRSSKPDFLSGAMFYEAKPYSVPYRCLYSKNISNLFMAGRNFSCSHIGLGGPRVMRTTGQMGAAVGLAASVCKKYNITPREVYRAHLKEYLALIESQK